MRRLEDWSDGMFEFLIYFGPVILLGILFLTVGFILYGAPW